jgi:hypothetical protein
LSELNEKIKKATEESGENNKIGPIRSALAILRKELVEMDQKR